MARNLSKGSGGAKAGVDIQGGQIENTPIGKAIARSASFGTADATSLSVSGATNLAGGTVLSGGTTLPAGTVLAGVTFRDVTAAGAISAQAGVLVLSLGSNVVYVPIYTGLA